METPGLVVGKVLVDLVGVVVDKTVGDAIGISVGESVGSFFTPRLSMSSTTRTETFS